MPIRIVKPGEHLDEIAFRHGVSPGDIWGLPQNEQLRGRRTGGNMLAAGDVLQVPAARHPTAVALVVGGDNAFRAIIPTTKVELVLWAGTAPMAAEPWRIEGRGEDASGVTFADGSLRFEVRVTTRHVRLFLERRGSVRDLVVGGLEPHDSALGVCQRLRNLGFYAGPAVAATTPELERALRAFQTSRGLTSTGALDAATLEALTRAHRS